MRRQEARGAQNAQRVVREIPGGDLAQSPGGEVREAAERVEPSPLPEIERHRVDGEVATLQVFVDRRAFDFRQIHFPLSRHAEDPRRGRRKSDRAAETRALHGARDTLGIGGDRGVDFGHGAAEQKIARGSPHDPDALTEPGADPRERGELRPPREGRRGASRPLK